MVRGVLLALLMGACACVAVRRIGPPDAAPTDAPPAEFSSARAMRHLRAVAQQPRLPGTPGHAEARTYILGELARLGLAAEVQESPLAANVLARLPGAARTGKAILLACHYDTVAGSAGAGDDGSGVAVVLETLRALQSGARPANDVIALFSDGEEMGLRGAKAFAHGHPWAREVGLVLNFEARGTTGPALMFETSAENGPLMNHFAQAAPRPVAYSLSRELYELMPNDTDLSVFKDAGLPGLNFAFIGNGATHYHGPLDNLENLDERSVQHQGSYAVALTREFGGASLENLRGPDAVYFDLLGAKFVLYSSRWALPLAGLILALAVAAVVVGRRSRRLSLAGAGKGIAAVLVCSAAAAVGVALAGRAAAALGAGEGVTALAAAFVALSAAALVCGWFCQRAGGADLLCGGLAWWLVLLLLTSLLWPGASYLFAWPLLAATAAAALWPAAEGAKMRAVVSVVLLLLSLLTCVALFAPVVYLALVAFGSGSTAAVVAVAFAASLAVVPAVPLLAPAEAARRVPADAARESLALG